MSQNSENFTENDKEYDKRPEKKTINSSGADYRCDYCRSDITNQIRIRCADCPDFDLCVTCFVHGAEVSPHKNTHRYRVIEHVTTPIFEQDWTGDEESLLLEAIQLYGFGNWSDVADHVGSKSKYRCETHYNRIYLESPDKPFPSPIITEDQIVNKEENFEDVKTLIEKLDRIPGMNYPSVKTLKPFSPPTVRVEEMHSSILNSVILGFMPKRSDFETEYKNDAEKVLADMEFSEDDTEADRELKMRVLKVYNKILDEREVRKDFLLKRGLTTVMPRNKKKLSPEEKEIHENMKPFARFHSNDSHERLVSGLCNELRLRNRIEQLQNYAVNGIKTLSEAATFGRKVSNTKDDQIKNSPSSRIRIKRRKIDKNDLDNWDIMKEVGFENLDEKEVIFCKAMKLKPDEYAQIKNAVEKESFVKGMISPKENCSFVTINVNKTPEQMDFMISKGWDCGGNE